MNIRKIQLKLFLVLLFVGSGLIVSVRADNTRIEALNGGVVDLSGVKQIIGVGNGVDVIADGAGSAVNLPNLELMLDDEGGLDSSLQALNQGMIELNSQQASVLGNHVNLQLTPSGLLSFNALTLNPGSAVYGGGTLPGSIVNSGLISPGQSDTEAGQLNILGQYTQTAHGKLVIDLGTADSGDDLVTVSGEVNLGGLLEVQTHSGFVSNIGQQFEIVSGLSRNGEFAYANGLSLPTGGRLLLEYSPSSVLLIIDSISFGTPVLEPIDDRTVKEGHQLSFFVKSSDPDGTVPGLTAEPLPMGASFTDRGNGMALFDWIPDYDQAGHYDITFTASDGLLRASKTARITVIDAEKIIKTYQIELRAGFNLINYPVSVAVEHQTCLGLLYSLGDDTVISSISRYDAYTGVTESCDHTQTSDFNIYTGHALIINMLQAQTLQISGAQICPVWLANPGQNYLGHSSSPAGLSCFDLINTMNGEMISAQKFNPITGRFVSCVWQQTKPVGINFSITPTDGLLINMDHLHIFTLPGCE